MQEAGGATERRAVATATDFHPIQGTSAPH